MSATALLAAAAIFIDESRVGDKLIPQAREVLREVLADAGLRSARVTSTERSFEKQVDLMLPQFRAAAAGTRRLIYGRIGTDLYHYYLELTELRPALGAAELRQRLIDSLKSAIDSHQGPRREMQHLPSGETYAFDLAPSSIKDPRALKAALKRSRKVIRCIFPGQGSEAAFHLEVSRAGKEREGAADCNAQFEHSSR